PVFLIDLRNCLGMIASVSTFSRSIGATRPLCTVNLFTDENTARGAVSFGGSVFFLLGRGAFDGAAGLLDVLAGTLHGVAAGEGDGEPDCKAQGEPGGE